MSALRVSRLDAAVRRLDGGYFHLVEVAEALGIHHDTLAQWRKAGLPQAEPSAQALIEGRWVYLYDLAAVERIRRFAERRGRRPRMWSAAEDRARDSARNRARQREVRAERLEQAGNRAEARRQRRIARQLRAELARQAARRRPRATSGA